MGSYGAMTDWPVSSANPHFGVFEKTKTKNQQLPIKIWSVNRGEELIEKVSWDILPSYYARQEFNSSETNLNSWAL